MTSSKQTHNIPTSEREPTVDYKLSTDKNQKSKNDFTVSRNLAFDFVSFQFRIHFIHHFISFNYVEILSMNYHDLFDCTIYNKIDWIVYYQITKIKLIWKILVTQSKFNVINEKFQKYLSS